MQTTTKDVMQMSANPIRNYLDIWETHQGAMSEQQRKFFWNFMLDDFNDWEDGYDPAFDHRVSLADFLDDIQSYVENTGIGSVGAVTPVVERPSDILPFLYRLADAIDYFWQEAKDKKTDGWFDFDDPADLFDTSTARWPVTIRLSDDSIHQLVPRH